MLTFTHKQNKPTARASFNITRSSKVVPAPGHEVHPMLPLQRTIGNQAVQRLQADPKDLEADSNTIATSRFAYDFSRIPLHAQAANNIQTKLTVNTPGDVYEQKADHVARQVMLLPEPQPQHACACGGECVKCRKEHGSRGHELSRQGQASNAKEAELPPILQDRLSNSKRGGSPMSERTRAFMEPRFAFDFSKVRIHADSNAARMNQHLGARAFTHGQDIYFGVGQSPSDYRLLTHELTHVVQQTGGVQSKLTVGQVMRQSDPSSLTSDSDNEGGGPPDGQALSSNQGQADGTTLKEACKLATEDCKSKLGPCPPERFDMDKTCTCWKGGEYGLEGGYTCIKQCRCKEPAVPIS